MSEKTVRVCDVCGKVFKDVASYCVLVQESENKAAPAELDEAELCKWLDLCPKHKERLLGFVNRGCSPLKGTPNA